MSDEISITLISSTTNQTETISLPSRTTTIGNLIEFATGMFGLNPQQHDIELIKDGHKLSSPNNKQSSLEESGVKNNDLIVVVSSPHQNTGMDFSNLLGTASTAATAPPAAAAASATPSSSSSLDFSSLLGSTAASATSSHPGGGGGGLTFHIPGLNSASTRTQTMTVEWPGISLDDAVSRNPNPSILVSLLFSPNHPNLLKELNYYSPDLARKLKSAGSDQEKAKIWREEMMKGSISRVLATTSEQTMEKGMKDRLKNDPMDTEANQYFEEKIRKENVESQYRQMMEEYPESLSKILMLYIPTKVNSHPIQAFVDSGAQSTIMSSSTAKKCNLFHLLDTRFAGIAVGVGTGTILGRVHLCPIQIQNHFFPCTITVMEDDNMEFLFGLDMLKRHKCRIDLGKGVLGFKLEEGGLLEVPFLHEKDLDVSKGGTRGFDAEKSNEELERSRRKKEEEEEEG